MWKKQNRAVDRGKENKTWILETPEEKIKKNRMIIVA